MTDRSHNFLRIAATVAFSLLCLLSFPAQAETRFSLPVLSFQGQEYVSLTELAGNLDLGVEKTPGVSLFTLSVEGNQVRLGDDVARVLVGEEWVFLSVSPRGVGEDLWLALDDMELLLRSSLTDTELEFSRTRGEEGVEWIVVIQDTAVPLEVEATPPTPAPGLPPSPPRPVVGPNFTIIIDAGHGGEDPGVLSQRTWTEKQVCLDIAMNLREVLLRRLGCQVKLTRKGDYAMSLDDRIAFANQGKQGTAADLFLSLHANASLDPQMTGFACYAATPVPTEHFDTEDVPFAGSVTVPGQGSFNPKAINELSRQLYERTFPEISPEVNGIEMFRIELLQNRHIGRSDRLRRTIVSNVQKRAGVSVLNIGEGPLRILRCVSMPAVLIELGFLTNVIEAQNLASKEYQAALAEAIAEGVVDFLSTTGI